MLAPYLTFQLKDSRKRIKRRTIQLDTQATLVDYQAVTTAMVSALNAVTDLELVKVELTLPQTGSFAGEADSNVDVGATFTGVLYQKQGQKASLKIPGFPMSLVNADGSITVAAVDVAPFLAFFLHATPYDAYVSDGETIEAWETGRLDK
jgi:hypothetical protein